MAPFPFSDTREILGSSEVEPGLMLPKLLVTSLNTFIISLIECFSSESKILKDMVTKNMNLNFCIKHISKVIKLVSR